MSIWKLSRWGVPPRIIVWSRVTGVYLQGSSFGPTQLFLRVDFFLNMDHGSWALAMIPSPVELEEGRIGKSQVTVWARIWVRDSIALNRPFDPIESFRESR